jgi:hypothetical protein
MELTSGNMPAIVNILFLSCMYLWQCNLGNVNGPQTWTTRNRSNCIAIAAFINIVYCELEDARGNVEDNNVCMGSLVDDLLNQPKMN